MTTPLQPIRIPDEVAGLLRSMHPQLKRKVRDSLRRILANPHEGKALQDELDGLRSFRIGRFRMIYRLRQGMIEIVAIGPREKIYQETYRLVRKTRTLER